MRYEPSQRLVRLALMLAGTRTGLSLDEIAQNLEVGRRSAERLRDAVVELFPQIEVSDDEMRVRRWRLPGTALAKVVKPRVEVVATVETLARELAAKGDAARAADLSDAAATLRAMMTPDALRRSGPWQGFDRNPHTSGSAG